ncbi:MAG: hypothetical protein NE330_09880 [Lentisphaeraceae bacterium]|nr:hypothetical protein [Lentisphaeraceae bacterium]
MAVKKQTLNYSVVLVMVYLLFDIFFSAFSPKWTEQLSDILIEDKTLILQPEKVKDIKPILATRFIKVGGVEVRTSLNIDSRQLKNICDRKNSTKVNFNLKSKRGDNVQINYEKDFLCKGVSLRLNGEESFRALLETSADGLVFHPVKILKPGANNIELQNEKIKSLRIVLMAGTDKPWNLGDISCR